MRPGTKVYYNHRARWLEKLIKEKNFTKGAEIGVFEGTTFKHLIENCPNLHLTGVDVFCSDKDWKRLNIKTTEELNKHPALERYDALLQFCENYSERAIVWRDFSNLAHNRIQDESLDFVFIDASHNYDSVLEDLKCWAPKIRKGGIVSGHDINMFGVRRAVMDVEYKFREAEDNVWYYEKS